MLRPQRILESLQGNDHPVLPNLGKQELVAILGRCTLEDALRASKSGILPLGEGQAIACRRAFATARQRGLALVAEFEHQQFLAAVAHLWDRTLCEQASLGLHQAKPVFSAVHRLSWRQALIATLTLVLGAALPWFGQFWLLVGLVVTASSVIFFATVALKFLVLVSPARRTVSVPPSLEDEQLPDYTVLVPLYRESFVLDDLLSCLLNLDYPKQKLDIKIIVEQRDSETRQALARFELPDHFSIIVVPRGGPQTKPRALNYALQFARGNLLTIYDAEDRPAPRQLRTAAEHFRKAGRGLACLQARLIVYNANENWLTRQFAAEYAVLFGELLPTLASLHLPIPLGGTSNHFRVSALKSVGAWDSFNVTEDADLGMRLARDGHETGVLDSDTFEEACITTRAWTNQRARWLKGFLHTWLVHMRQPVRSWNELRPLGFWVLNAITLGVFLSALVHPITLAVLIWHVLMAQTPVPGLWHVSTWTAGFSLALFAAGYAVNLLLAARSARRSSSPNWKRVVVTSPAYWVLMMPAAWLALYQFVTDVHGWNKTQHGVSKLLKS